MKKRIVIIGTGAGGLGAAAYLAATDHEVIALEQAKRVGGFLNPFARKRFEFDPGVHYVGEIEPGGTIHTFYKGLGLDAEQAFVALDDDFDHFHFPDFQLAMCKGRDAYRDRLAARFPHDVASVDRFFAQLDQFHALLGVGQVLQGRRPRRSDLRALKAWKLVGKYGRATYGELLRDTVRDPKLRAVLAAQGGDYGLPPSRAAAGMGLALVGHYLKGAYFPRGGSRKMRDDLLEIANAGGVTFRTRTRASRIVVDDKRVTGVELDTGEVIRADVVISAIDPTITFESLIGPRHVPRRLAKKTASMSPSIGSFCLFLGMNRDLRDHGMGAHNIWSYPHWDLDRAYAPVLRGELSDELPIFLSPNSIKEGSGTMAPEGGSTLEVVTFAPFEPFKPWADTRCHRRPQAYTDLKERIADQLMETLERRHPGLVGDVVVREAATPLTNDHYVGTRAGGIYGPAATPEQSFVFRYAPKTPIHGLFLAGAGVFGAGIAPSLMSGRVAAGLAKR